MNHSTTLLRLTKAVLLVATLLGYCASLPAVSRPKSAMMDGAAVDTSKAPKLKQLQETSHGTATRTHEFPANSIDSLERDMREAETTTTAEVMAETTQSMASGDESSSSATEEESTTAPTQTDSEASADTHTARTERSPSPRDHFKALMRGYYTNPNTGVLELASFFSMAEMYRLGPLATDPRVDNPPSTLLIENSRDLCDSMANRLNTRQTDTDYCHWTYTCNYNANRFPSMIINATECTTAAGVNARCVQRATKMQTFTRTFADGGVEATWTRDSELAIVVYAYTCRRRY